MPRVVIYGNDDVDNPVSVTGSLTANKIVKAETAGNIKNTTSISEDSSGNVTIGDGTNQTAISSTGGLTLAGAATTYDDFYVDIISDPMGGSPAPALKLFKNDGTAGTNYWVNYGTSASNYGSMGCSSYSDLDTAITSNAFTISQWIKIDSAGTTGIKGVFSIPGKLEIGVYTTGVQRPYIRVNAGGYTTAPITITNGVVYHFLLTYDGTNFRLYVNNVLRITLASAALSSLPATLYQGITDTGLNPVCGGVSNLRIYNIVLSASQIAELYNSGAALAVASHPTGVTEATQVIASFKNTETGGSTLDNFCTLGAGKDITLSGSVTFPAGHIGSSGSFGVYLLAYENTGGESESIRWEMPHNWKMGTAISMHEHFANETQITAGETIIFTFEYTIQQIYGVLNANGSPQLTVLDATRQFGNTTLITKTFTPASNIPAYSHILFEFPDITMSTVTTVSTVGVGTVRRLTGTYTGALFIINAMRGHYEIDSFGSNTEYTK